VRVPQTKNNRTNEAVVCLFLSSQRYTAATPGPHNKDRIVSDITTIYIDRDGAMSTDVVVEGGESTTQINEPLWIGEQQIEKVSRCRWGTTASSSLLEGGRGHKFKKFLIQ
jgi:hypothetical protein